MMMRVDLDHCIHRGNPGTQVGMVILSQAIPSPQPVCSIWPEIELVRSVVLSAKVALIFAVASGIRRKPGNQGTGKLY